jgi:hypothetical protein
VRSAHRDNAGPIRENGIGRVLVLLQLGHLKPVSQAAWLEGMPTFKDDPTY